MWEGEGELRAKVSKGRKKGEREGEEGEEGEGKWVNVLRDAALLSFRKWHYGNLLSPLAGKGIKF